MKLQGFERINQAIRDAFPEKKSNHPEQMRQRLKFSWSNCGVREEICGAAFAVCV